MYHYSSFKYGPQITDIVPIITYNALQLIRDTYITPCMQTLTMHNDNMHLDHIV